MLYKSKSKQSAGIKADNLRGVYLRSFLPLYEDRERSSLAPLLSRLPYSGWKLPDESRRSTLLDWSKDRPPPPRYMSPPPPPIAAQFIPPWFISPLTHTQHWQFWTSGLVTWKYTWHIPICQYVWLFTDTRQIAVYGPLSVDNDTTSICQCPILVSFVLWSRYMITSANKH